MKRVIVEYAKLTKDILDMLIDKYPDGYDYEDIISFKNAKGETVKAIEVKTGNRTLLLCRDVRLIYCRGGGLTGGCLDLVKLRPDRSSTVVCRGLWHRWFLVGVFRLHILLRYLYGHYSQSRYEQLRSRRLGELSLRR